MPSKREWQRLLDKTWYWSKIILALFILTLLSYGYGTYHPNKHAKSKVNAELDKYYIGKSPAMAGDEGLKKICDLRLITLTALLL